MPAIIRFPKTNIYNIERENVRHNELQNNERLTLNHFINQNVGESDDDDDDYEPRNIDGVAINLRPPHVEDLEQDERDAVIYRYINNLFITTLDNFNDGDFSTVYEIISGLFDGLFYGLNCLTTITADNEIVRYGEVRNYRLIYKQHRNWKTYRISLMDDNYETQRLELDRNRAIHTMLSGSLFSLNCDILTSNFQLTSTTINQYEPIPGFPNYRINKLAPYNIIDSNYHTIQPLPATDKCKYLRYKLGNKFIYLHKLIAWINRVPGWQRLNFTMSRAEYFRTIHSGNLYVIDHLDNNPMNNDFYNLRVINQSRNLARRRY